MQRNFNKLNCTDVIYFSSVHFRRLLHAVALLSLTLWRFRSLRNAAAVGRRKTFYNHQPVASRPVPSCRCRRRDGLIGRVDRRRRSPAPGRSPAVKTFMSNRAARCHGASACHPAVQFYARRTYVTLTGSGGFRHPPPYEPAVQNATPLPAPSACTSSSTRK